MDAPKDSFSSFFNDILNGTGPFTPQKEESFEEKMFRLVKETNEKVNPSKNEEQS
jgi:hypothetical protein